MPKAIENTDEMTAEIDDKMSFENALSELDSLVRSLESGQASLEDSIKAYERGMILKNLCEKRLKDAKLRVEKISLSADGKAAGTTPFKAE
jgi:exodeoxyribonuclease VII small subunit